MKVLLDARKLSHGGIGRYIETVIESLALRDDITLYALSLSSNEDLIKKYKSVSVISTEIKPNSIFQKASDFNIEWKDFDVFHSPYFIVPFGVPIPYVVTIHDLIQITHPEKWYYPFIAKRVIGRSVRRASQVITVSNATRREVEKLYPKSISKINCIPNAWKGTSSSDNKEVDREESPYFLSILSNQKPHKGYSDLISAFKESYPLLSSILPGVKLKVAGYGTDEGSIVSDLGSSFVAEGPVTDKRLDDLYSGAHSVIIPSLTEGFGYMSIESHARGIPVVCRPVPALLELVDSDDVIAEDFSVEALSAAIITSAQRGIRVIKFDPAPFSLNNFADSLMKVYGKAK